MAPVQHGAKPLLPFAGLIRRVADLHRGLDEALGGEWQHDIELCTELERRLGENDVGPRGKRAVDDADIMRGENLLGAPADERLDRVLPRRVELLAPEDMAGEHRHVART